jgi:ribosomal-protein-alanine N-acetyltransferase
VLRAWQPADAPAIVAAYSDAEIRQWHDRSMNEIEALDWIASWPKRWHDEIGCGWAASNEDRLLGQISLRRVNLDEGIAEISYWVLTQARGRQVATPALAAVTTWWFDVLGLHRIDTDA